MVIATVSVAWAIGDELQAQVSAQPADQTSAISTGESSVSDQTERAAEAVPESAAFPLKPLRRHVLIVIGLPGDAAHQIRFEKTAATWRKWLIDIAGVADQDIVILSTGETAGTSTTLSSAANITREARRLAQAVGAGEGFWLFLLGHGSQDERHGWFHLPGKDLDSTQWASLFAEIQASEQVMWLTQAASGAFLKPMSRPGRIVIAASDTEGEVNETLFPLLLADTMQLQLDGAGDGPTTDLLDLFHATSQEVNQLFESRQLLPTEHAQLDDNGDGIGSEISDLDPETTGPQVDSTLPLVDGVGAKKIIFALPSVAKPDPSTSTDEPLSPNSPESASERPSGTE